jgi:DNA repair exonuclease SbcCD ATPase subunit
MEDRMIERVTTLEGSMKTAFNKLKEHDEEIKEIRTDNKILHEMNRNISVLATNYENQGKTITRIECDVKELKEKPAKRWNTLETVIITVIVSGILGFILGKVFGG